MKFYNLLLIAILISSLTLSSLARERVSVNFSGLEIHDFAKLISKITNKNILLNYPISGKVNLVTTAPIYEDEVIGILISVLKSKGFTLIENGSVYEIVRSADAAKFNLPIVSMGREAAGNTMTTQAIRLKREGVATIAAKIRHLASKSAKIITMKESNTILITDYPKNIETIKRITKDLEEKNGNIVEIVEIKNAQIKELHKEISSISIKLFNQKIDSEKVTILTNSSTRSLILVGKKKNLLQLTNIIHRLDRESSAGQEVSMYALKNSDADSIVETLTQIVNKRVYADASLKPSVSANSEINSVVLVGDPSIIKGLRHIIGELDKEKFQVYVQARIVEISGSASEKIGLKYGLGLGVKNSSGLYTLSSNFGGSYNPLGIDSSIIDIGEVSQFLALGAALDFLQSKGASRTLSNPSILCVNNQESSIHVGKTISIETGSFTNTGGTSGNISTNYKREDVGLTLKIKPRVSNDNKVTLDIESNLENVIAKDADTSQPITSKQKIKTQAILRHGESIIIGGLVRSYTTTSTSKIPLLGDIPLIGAAFRNSSEDEERDNLLVILTPYIIDKSEKLSLLQRQLGDLEALQERYNFEVFSKIEAKAKKND